MIPHTCNSAPMWQASAFLKITNVQFRHEQEVTLVTLSRKKCNLNEIFLSAALDMLNTVKKPNTTIKKGKIDAFEPKKRWWQHYFFRDVLAQRQMTREALLCL